MEDTPEMLGNKLILGGYVYLKPKIVRGKTY